MKYEYYKLNIGGEDYHLVKVEAHKIFYNKGFGPKGFHFVRILE